MAIQVPQTTKESAQKAAEEQAAQVTEQQAPAVEAAEPAAAKAPEVEAPTAKPEPTQVATAEVATPATAKVATPAMVTSNAVADLADEGFEGLVVNGMSFNRIKLNNGRFQFGSEGRDIGDSFTGQILTTKALYVFKCDPEDDNSDVFYSYTADGSLLSDGSSSESTLQSWAEKGYSPDEKTGLWHSQKYVEAMVSITDCNDETVVGDVVICQIPPASIPRFSGFISLQWMRTRQKPSDFETKFKVGATVKKNRTEFNPWEFAVAK